MEALAEGTRGGTFGMGAQRPRRRGAGGAFGISYSESSIGSEAPLILMSLLFSLSGGLSSKR